MRTTISILIRIGWIQQVLVLWAVLYGAIPLTAEVYHVHPRGRWFEVISGDRLRPGDEVILAGGVYRDQRRLVIGHRGTAEQPVLIRATDGAQVVIHRPDARRNSIDIVGGQHLILRGIEITGGSAGIRLVKSDRHPCKFVTIERMHIHHVGGAAVTANNEGNAYEGLIFRQNHIHHTSGHGEGFYLGCNNGPDGDTTGYMFNSIIEGNYIHHLNGANVSQGDGIEIKDGSFNNIVRDNVIHDTNYPGVILFGTDGKEPNIVERNVIWNSADHGIQAAADAIIRNNLVFNVQANGIHSKAHQSAKVGKLEILHNTVVCNRSGSAGIRISVRGDRKPYGPVTIANNAIFGFDGGFAMRLPPARISNQMLTVAGNIGTGGIEGLAASLSPETWQPTGELATDLDRHLYPLAGSSLINAADRRYQVSDDFNGRDRGSTLDAGAYLFSASGNPGWSIGPGFKARSSARK